MKPIRRPRGGLWDNPDFMRLWAAQSLSAIGARFTREGLPIIAALLLDASATDMGLLVAMSAVPAVLLSPLAGAWIDRTRRRRVLIIADLARAVVLITLPVAAWLGAITIEQILAVGTLVMFFSMLFQIADNAYLPSVVGKDHILESNSKLATSEAVAEIAGPALAGMMIQAFTAPIAILFDAASYLWSAAFLARIKQPEVPIATGETAPDLRREMVEGLRFVMHHPVLRPMTLCSASLAFFLGLFGPLYILFAVRVLEIPPGLLGFLIAIGGVSALAGARLTAKAALILSPRALLISALLAYCLGLVFIPLASGPVWMAALFLGASQILCDGLYIVFYTNAVTLRQKVTPDAMRGREGGMLHLVAGGLGIVAALVAGIMGDTVGIRPVLWVAIAGAAASAGWLLLLPSRIQETD
jgi:predicted MFS family arabinose efflux permease